MTSTGLFLIFPNMAKYSSTDINVEIETMIVERGLDY